MHWMQRRPDPQRRRTRRVGRLFGAWSAGLLFTLAGAAPAIADEASAAAKTEGIQKIQHVVVIMQENRSLDTYFGTYPGANGIPAGICLPNKAKSKCVKPFYDPETVNLGGPHGAGSSITD
jgi:phospholipase C